jgi:acyl carrier protein phosphodiesterase
MNYLAHAYLSFKDQRILVGNMISDFVKGKKKFDYDDIIQKGIMLHRAIDEFTDRHETTRQSKVFFRPAYGLYSGAFVDVAYDHFLATDSREFTEGSLLTFSLDTYSQLSAYEQVFPEKFKIQFYHMRSGNWLFNYRLRNSMYRSFAGLVNRSAYMHEHQTAYTIFEQHYEELRNIYQVFFPELKNFAMQKMRQLHPD